MKYRIDNEKKFLLALVILTILSTLSIIISYGQRYERDNNSLYTKIINIQSENSYIYVLSAPEQELFYDVIDSSGVISETYKLQQTSSRYLLSGKKDVLQVRISSPEPIVEELEFGFVPAGESLALKIDSDSNVLGVTADGSEAVRNSLIQDAGVEYVPFSVWSSEESGEQEIQFTEVEKIVVVPIPDGTDDLVEYLYAMRSAMSDECGSNVSECAEIPLDYNYVIDVGGVVYEGFTNALYGSGELISDEGDLVIGVVDGESLDSARALSKLVNILSKLNGLKEEDLEFNNLLKSDLFNKLITEYNLANKGLARVNEVMIEEEDGLLEVETYENFSVARTGDKTQLIISEGISPEGQQVLDDVESTTIAVNMDTNIEVIEVPSEVALQVVNTVNLLSDDRVTIQPNYMYRLTSWDNGTPGRSVPSDYDSSTQWNLEKIMAPEAWSDLGGCTVDDSCGGDPSVVVAVLDTGVAYENFDYDSGASFTTTHHDPFYFEVPTNPTANSVFNEGYDREYLQAPELTDVNFVDPFDSWQYYACNSLRLEGSADPCNAAETAKINHANDDHGHGTFVTTIIAGTAGDAAPNNLVGIAHNVSIMPVKVFTPNDTSMCQDEYGDIDLTCADPSHDYRAVAFTTNILDGIDHAVTNGADVINMSLGGVGTDIILNAEIQDATDDGVLVVVAAGNDGDDATYYFPANSPGAYVVGAVDDANNRASYSNYGAEIDLVAPVGASGGDMVSSMKYMCSTDGTCADETDANLFQTFTSQILPIIGIGTSYAAPQVSAAAALLLSDDPTMTVTQLKSAISNSAIDLGATGKDTDFGYGLLDIEAAINREINVEDPDPNDQYFTWYDTSESDRKTWVLVGNPSSTSAATVGIDVGTVLSREYTVQPENRITPRWDGYLDGPVHVTSDLPIYATQRVLFEGSFNEYAGIPSANLTNKYYFTWYDTSSSNKKAWILVGNPSSSETAHVNIKIGSGVNQNFTIPPEGRITPKWGGRLDGPVVVTSDIDVYASQRVLFEGTFNEFAGIPANSLTDEYYFTWYDTSVSDRKAWILVGNPSGSKTASVNIKIGTQVNQNFSIPPGGRITPKWNGRLDGPIIVSSNINVYATQRVLFEGSFNEYAGIPVSSLDTEYYFTWYDTSEGSRKAWVLVGNPSLTESASVNIKVGNSIDQNYTIPAGSRITPRWNEVLDGPVVVTSDIPVYATQRVLFDGDFNEYPGIITND